MKTKMFLLIVSFFMILTSCSDDSNKTTLDNYKYEMPRSIKIDIPDGQILAINSKQEFAKYFNASNCMLPEGTKFASIDYKTYTLIYVQGESTNGIYEIKSSMNTDSTPYILSIDIKQNYTTVMERWNVAYLIKKQEEPNVSLQYHIGH